MAYRRQNHDPYYGAEPTNNYPQYPQHGNTGAAVDYPPHNSDYDHQSNWDAKSTKSFQSGYTGSQVHLNPYEMSQVSVNVPPVPSMPYTNYPPARSGMYREQSTAGYSVAREKMMNRRSVRQVELFQGNLVLDMQVPSHIVPSGKQDIEEFSKMRYTAATCDPDDFMASRYSLRPYLLGRQTELFIVMTMYNEDEVLFVRTMNAWVVSGLIIYGLRVLSRFFSSVIKNVAHLCSRTRSKMWGPEGWKKVVVCVVSDGRNKVNKRTLQVLSLVSTVIDPLHLITSFNFTYRWDATKKALPRIPWGRRTLLPTYSS
jgi:Chitin synthase./Chitin synthase N-terminal.